ncbi:MAG: hypothetical protein M0P31_19175 [Solirubrobacteraceae bacterium]|nr:hypothetical protein [Solirubrobacteraceae bacterium]
MTLTARLLTLLTVVVLAGGGVTIALVDTDGDGRPDTITVPLGPPQLERADLPDTLTIDRDALQAAAKTDAGDHQGARDEVPDGVPVDELRAGQAQQDRLAADDRLPIVTPLAAPSQRGCSSRFVRNYSSRRGVRPRLFVVHYTVSSNRPGWSDVNAIVGLFNQASFAASSTYVIDDEGHCAYIVRESDKP